VLVIRFVCLVRHMSMLPIVLGVNIGFQVSLVALILPGEDLVKFLLDYVHVALQGLGWTLAQSWTLVQR